MPVKGIVKWFNDAKGFGFISVLESPYYMKDVFVHHRDIKNGGFRTLVETEHVLLDVVEGTKGLTAANVIRVKEIKKGDDYYESPEPNRCPHCHKEL